jgi:ribonuclease BN (tRNA processing enzyme)
VIKLQTKGKSIVYATDTEGYIGGDTRLIDFSQNASLLIHDAQYDVEQYPKMQGYGHSTYEMAAKVAESAKVEKLALFHHDPGHEDNTLREIETRAKQCFANTIMAYEGLELTL